MKNDFTRNDNVHKYLTFWSNGNIYGVSSMDVLQIIQMSYITSIPETPKYIRGILHLRGHNIPIIDLGLRLSEAASEKGDEAKIIVLSTSEGELGLIVESIGEIADISSSDISAIPKIADAVEKHVISSIALHNGRLIPILDILTLLSDDALSNIDLDKN